MATSRIASATPPTANSAQKLNPGCDLALAEAYGLLVTANLARAPPDAGGAARRGFGHLESSRKVADTDRAVLLNPLTKLPPARFGQPTGHRFQRRFHIVPYLITNPANLPKIFAHFTLAQILHRGVGV